MCNVTHFAREAKSSYTAAALAPRFMTLCSPSVLANEEFAAAALLSPRRIDTTQPKTAMS